MADNSLKSNLLWFTGGNGRRAEHGTLQLVAGTAAVLTTLSRFDAVLLTPVGAVVGTSLAYVNLTPGASTANGGISPSSGNLLVASADTGAGSTAIYSFFAIGY